MSKKMMKKIVLLGDSAVGKTSLIRRFVHDQFSDSYISTIGTKVSKKEMQITFEGDDYDLNLMVWDMLGREGYVSTQARQLVGAQGVIIVGDITRPETLQNMEKYWIPMVLRTIGTVKLPFLFLGNKSDIADQDKLSSALEIMEDLETRYNCGMKESIPKELNTWFLTSALAGDKVEDAFQSIAHLLFYFDRAEDPFYDKIQDIIIKGLSGIGDKSTVVGALDQIVFEFSESYGNIETAGKVVREEAVRAGLDHNNPEKQKVRALAEYLIEALVQEEIEEAMVNQIKDRWLAALEDISE